MHIIEEQLLSNHVQSAYKRYHSTETAIFKIHNDIIICNMDNGKVTAPTLLDMSAAFDTIDHSTLLERLHGHFGISGWYSFFNGSNHTFQTDSNFNRWLTFMPAISSCRRPAGVCPWPFSVVFILNVNKSNH